MASNAAPQALRAAEVTAFVGLGAMGYPMAGHMAKQRGRQCLVWSRCAEKRVRHAAEFGSKAVQELSDLGAADVVVMCLPTSVEDEEVGERLAPHLKPGACLVSCTSGEPSVSRRLAESLERRFSVRFLDCPVSGGPRGAAAGTLTCMMGVGDRESQEMTVPVLEAFAKKIVRCGPPGAGHAVKAVNNALNATHLLLGAEGLLALQAIGVDPKVALEAINGSSGRSLQTEERLPQEVLTRRFGYGFTLEFMAKDCAIARRVIQEGFPSASLLPEGVKKVEQAASEELPGKDYTCCVQMLEREAGFTLASKSQTAEVLESLL